MEQGMKKGQIYIVIAVMIIIAITTLANIAIHTSKKIEEKQARISNAGEMALNLKIEISKMQRNNISSGEINNFISIFKNYSQEKNYKSNTTEINS